MSQEQFDTNHQSELIKTAETVDKADSLLRFLRWACIVIILFLAYGTILLTRVDGNTDRNSNAVSQLEESTNELNVSVDDLQRFAHALEDQSPEEAARNAAITQAVNEVPVLRGILCDPTAFPEAAGCQEDPPPPGP